MKHAKRILLALLITFSIYQTHEARTYKQKCEVLTSHVFDLAEKRMDSIFNEKTFVSLPSIHKLK